MPSSNVRDFTVQEKENNFYFNLTVEKNFSFNLVCINSYNFIFALFGFAISNSIYVQIKQSINFVGASILKKMMMKNPSTSFIKLVSNFRVIKKIQTFFKAKLNTTLQIKSIKKMTVNFSDTFTIGKYTILDGIDNKTLGELDSKTLDYIDRFYKSGIAFITRKMMNMPVKSQLQLIVDLKLYKYSTLLNQDTKTLGSMDNVTLGDLDKILI